MRFLLSVAALLLAVLIQDGHGAAFERDSYSTFCAKSCPETEPDSIQPKVESTYVYGLKAKTLLTPRATQAVTITADVKVSIIGKCETHLLLRNVNLDGVEHGHQLASQLQAHPIAFSYYDGKVREVCHQKGDEIWAMNIKKAVISALQLNSIKDDRLKEVDISGKCPTIYSQQPGAYNDETIILKQKDLYQCTDRHLKTTTSPSSFKQLFHQLFNPMSSTQTCKYTLKDRIVHKVECKEDHSVEPFGRKAIHYSTLNLELKSEEHEAVIEKHTGHWVRQDISLQLHDESTQVSATSKAEVIQVLQQLCQSVSGKTAHIESSGIFAKLVDQLKRLPHSETSSLHSSIKSGSVCPLARKRLLDLFHDASAFAATDGSIVNLVAAYNDKELSTSRAVGYFGILALKATPKNDETIRALVPLIESTSTSRPLLLSVSNLIRRFCDQSNDCQTNAAVDNAIGRYLNRLKVAKSPSEKITLIKALKNLNRVNSETIANQMEAIISLPEVEDDVRLVAFQALPSRDDNSDLLRSILLESSNSNEMRIVAFHQLAALPGQLEKINEILDEMNDFSMKNYIVTYLENHKNADNPTRQAMVPRDLVLHHYGARRVGVTRHILKEYGPLAIDGAVIFPKNSNVTQTVIFQFNMASNDKIIPIAEFSIRQQGLNKLVGSMINLFEKKITSAQFNNEFAQDLVLLLKKLDTKRNDLYGRDKLQINIKLGSQNVAFFDALEDLAVYMEMAKRAQELATTTSSQTKQEDAIFGGVLFDNLDFVVPTTTGIPLHYKLNINGLLQTNGQMKSQTSKTYLIMNRSLIAGISTSVRLQLADQKVGYEYNGKLAFTPNFDIEFEQNGKNSLSMKWNLKEDKQVFLKATQSGKELKQVGGAEQKEVEFAPEFRVDRCTSMLILNYCRKMSHMSSPYVEYYITKPESAITALKFDLDLDVDNPMLQSLTLRANALGTTTNYEHLAQLQHHNLFGISRKAILKLQSPDGSFETALSISMFDGKTAKVKLDTPNFKLDGKFDQKQDGNKNEVLLQYRLPNDDELHFVKFENHFATDGTGYGYARSNVTHMLNFTWLIESSQLPWLNHRSRLSTRNSADRQLDSNKANMLLEFAYGPTMENVYRFEKAMEVEASKIIGPKKIYSTKESSRYVATDFGLNYGFKGVSRISIEDGESLDVNYNVTGTDYSKSDLGAESFRSKIHLQNKGQSLDSVLDASVNYSGEEFAFHSELKRVRPRKYEGKFSLEW